MRITIIIIGSFLAVLNMQAFADDCAQATLQIENSCTKSSYTIVDNSGHFPGLATCQIIPANSQHSYPVNRSGLQVGGATTGNVTVTNASSCSNTSSASQTAILNYSYYDEHGVTQCDARTTLEQNIGNMGVLGTGGTDGVAVISIGCS